MRERPSKAYGLAAFAFCSLVHFSFSKSASALLPIYGNDVVKDDNRVELQDQTSALAHEQGHAVAMVVDSSQVMPTSNNNWMNVAALPLGKKENLKPGTRFENELAPGFCTGVLVGNSFILTASHCVVATANDDAKAACKTLAFVFDYYEQQDALASKNRVKIPAANVYTCSDVSAIDLNVDFALLALDRPVEFRSPLSALAQRAPITGENVYMIGHPNGLPMKYTGPDPLLDVGQTNMRVQLDAFEGNSGSPIFSENDGSLIGLLVSGSIDTKPTQDGQYQEYTLYPTLTPAQWASPNPDKTPRFAEDLVRVDAPAIQNALKQSLEIAENVVVKR